MNLTAMYGLGRSEVRLDRNVQRIGRNVLRLAGSEVRIVATHVDKYVDKMPDAYATEIFGQPTGKRSTVSDSREVGRARTSADSELCLAGMMYGCLDKN